MSSIFSISSNNFVDSKIPLPKICALLEWPNFDLRPSVSQMKMAWCGSAVTTGEFQRRPWMLWRIVPFLQTRRRDFLEVKWMMGTGWDGDNKFKSSKMRKGGTFFGKCYVSLPECNTDFSTQHMYLNCGFKLTCFLYSIHLKWRFDSLTNNEFQTSWNQHLATGDWWPPGPLKMHLAIAVACGSAARSLVSMDVSQTGIYRRDRDRKYATEPSQVQIVHEEFCVKKHRTIYW